MGGHVTGCLGTWQSQGAFHTHDAEVLIVSPGALRSAVLAGATMSFTDMTRPPVTRRRIAALIAIALVGAVAAALVLSTRAGAQQVTTITVSPENATNKVGTVHAMGITVSPAQANVQVRYRVLSGPNAGLTGPGDTNANGFIVFSYPGNAIGTDAILIWADLDRDGVRDGIEPLTASIVEWVGVAGTGIELVPASSAGPVNASHTSTATLLPAQSGVIVRFSVATGPNAGRNGVGVTNSNGQASFSYFGTGGLGTDTIVAWPDFDADGARDGNEPQATATRLWTSAGTGGVSVVPVSAQKSVNEQHSVHATLSSGQSGLFMRFAVTSGPNAGKTGVALTSGGRATYTYVGRANGIDVVTAWVDFDMDALLDTNEPRGQATVSWGTATPTRTIAATPQGDTNPVGAVHTVTGTISPAESGKVVRFRVAAGPHLGATGRAVTNNAGQASYSYRGIKAGTDSITVWLDLDDDGVLDSGEPRSFASKLWTTTVPVQSITLQPGNNVALVGTTHTLTSTVSPARSGAIVRFLVTVGPNQGDAGVAVTNSQGRATFAYVGNGGVGNDAIVSWLDLNNNGVRETNEPHASAIQRWASAQVNGISVAPETSSGQVNTQHTVTATVSPVAQGVLVRFRITQGPNAGDEGSALTNSNGRASFGYLGNGGVGSDLILVWTDFDGDGVIDANEPQSVALRSWTAVAGSAFSLSPANDTNPVNTRHSMVATVAPAQRHLLVRFEVTAGPNEGTRGSDDTNSSGRADLSYVGDEGVGTDVILAWVDFDRDGRIDSGEPQAVATKQWIAAAPRTLVLSPTNDTNPVNTRHSFTGTVSPTQRNLKVRFEVTAGPNEGTRGSDDTNSNGRADLSYVGDEGPGTDIILGWIDLDRDGRLDAGEPQSIATKRWVVPTVSALTLAPGVDTERVGRTHKVTAQLTPKLSGVLIRFSILSGPNAGESDRERTNRDGRAADSYRGNGGVGTDLILAWADLDEDGVLDPGEHQATALVTWTADLDDRARAAEICDNLDRYSHPSLSTLCGLVESGKLSDHSEGVIIGIILKNAEKSIRRSDRDHHDHDDDDDDDD